jgi:Mlc titration factor MtfA (ptsG expression regulator)
LSEKEIVVSDDIRNPEVARLLIAATASLMLLGFRDLYCFDKIKSVILQSGAVIYRKRANSNEVISREEIASGVYMQGGPVVLSWDDVSQQCFSAEHGNNVVIHEFAHHIDDLNGAMDGEPPFPTATLATRWKESAEAAMERVEELDSIGITSVIDVYGLTNKLEFFAVSCEAFYCNPAELQGEFPEIFDLLCQLFQLNPQQWFERE